MVYKIADLYFDITSVYPQTAAYCRNYRCEDPPRIDTVIAMTEADILQEQETEGKGGEKPPLSAELEWLALYRKICAFVLAHDAFLMHCAVIEYEGRGYAFTAPSGTGKTTHIRLWRQVFGKDKVTVVNGDKPILRVIDGVVYAYGTPWCGKEGYNANTRVPLCGICFIERGAQNRVSRMSDVEAAPRLLGQVMVTDSTDLARQLELCDILLESVPFYRLVCNTEPEAAHVAYEAMRSERRTER